MGEQVALDTVERSREGAHLWTCVCLSFDWCTIAWSTIDRYKQTVCGRNICQRGLIFIRNGSGIIGNRNWKWSFETGIYSTKKMSLRMVSAFLKMIKIRDVVFMNIYWRILSTNDLSIRQYHARSLFIDVKSTNGYFAFYCQRIIYEHQIYQTIYISWWNKSVMKFNNT